MSHTCATRAALARIRKRISSRTKQNRLLELIESAVVAKIPTTTREKFAAMLKLDDYRHTTFDKEIDDEIGQDSIDKGVRKGEKIARAKCVRAATASALTANRISALLDIAVVRRILKAKASPSD